MAPSAGQVNGTRSRAKLSYRERRELETLPGEIEALEAEQRSLAAKMHHPGYWQSGEVLRTDHRRSAEIETLLMAKLERWEALEAKAEAAAS